MGKTYGVHSWKPEQMKLPKLNMSDLERNPDILLAQSAQIFGNF